MERRKITLLDVGMILLAIFAIIRPPEILVRIASMFI